jgi:hypothetical protein
MAPSETNVKQRLWRGRQLLREGVHSLIERVQQRPGARGKIAAAVALAIAGIAPSQAAASKTRWSPLAIGGGAAVAVLATALVVGRSTLPQGGVSSSPTETSSDSRPAPVRSAAGMTSDTPIATVATPATEPTTLFRLDFEDGFLPSITRNGHLHAGGPNAQSRYSAVGSMFPGWAGWHVDVSMAIGPDARDNVVLGPAAAIAFDYWLGEGDSIRVILTQQEILKEHHFRIRSPAIGQWSHVEIPLSEFRAPTGKTAAGKTAGRSLAGGDPIGRIHITAGRLGGLPFYVDNIEILDRATPTREGPGSSR